MLNRSSVAPFFGMAAAFVTGLGFGCTAAGPGTGGQSSDTVELEVDLGSAGDVTVSRVAEGLSTSSGTLSGIPPEDTETVVASITTTDVEFSAAESGDGEEGDTPRQAEITVAIGPSDAPDACLDTFQVMVFTVHAGPDGVITLTGDATADVVGEGLAAVLNNNFVVCIRIVANFDGIVILHRIHLSLHRNLQGDEREETAPLLIFFQGRPSDGYSQIHLEVDEVEILDDADESQGKFQLSESVRVDLLDADFSGFVGCIPEATVGEFGKLRLRVADPRLVREDGSEIDSSAIDLNADGKLDLNTQGDKFRIEAGRVNVIVFTLNDDDNALKVTETGNDRYKLRTEVFVSSDTVLSRPLVMRRTLVLLRETHGDGLRLTVRFPDCERTVTITVVTVILTADGTVMTLEDLAIDQVVDVIGELDGEEVIATEVTIVE